MGSAVNNVYNHENWERILQEQIDAVDPADTSSMVDTEPGKRAMA